MLIQCLVAACFVFTSCLCDQIDVLKLLEQNKGKKNELVEYPYRAYLISSHLWLLKYDIGLADITREQLYNIELTGSYLLRRNGTWALYDDELKWTADISNDYLNYMGVKEVGNEIFYEDLLELYESQAFEGSIDKEFHIPSYEENIENLKNKFISINNLILKCNQGTCNIDPESLCFLARSRRRKFIFEQGFC